MIQIKDTDTPIMVAQKLIHGTKPVTWTPASKLGYIIATGEAPLTENNEADMFSDAEIREIADYLLTYSKYHEEDEA